ncbi:uncharacterized protein FIBRA_06191 [Fibroporia radiculosa]|uniref:Uncharacterized protein n=1 Tax=Fibroporia radiculosa TaxID=599839 RepID=J4H3Y1_9APHY|nr:uncharacterized protein FIBRA_06191 [Fibroporia radiculosa]CCM04034.1 predicted protein [Fibroporia radiculosa]
MSTSDPCGKLAWVTSLCAAPVRRDSPTPRLDIGVYGTAIKTHHDRMGAGQRRPLRYTYPYVMYQQHAPPSMVAFEPLAMFTAPTMTDPPGDERSAATTGHSFLHLEPGACPTRPRMLIERHRNDWYTLAHGSRPVNGPSLRIFPGIPAAFA